MPESRPSLRHAPGAGTRLHARMTPRSPHEPHRGATSLELFFDLVFVVAISQASSELHHALAEGHAGPGVSGFLLVFFAIWWAWMNFTWFASAYDCDDVLYRIAVLIQMGGALMLAAGVPAMFETRAPNVGTIGGYVLMRFAMVSQWLRASLSDPGHRTTARRYALGIAVVQVGWVACLVVPGLWPAGFFVFAPLELLVPAWAERASPTTWHPHHVAERYGLFTLIVLGESVLAATMAVQAALATGEQLAALVPLAISGLVIVYGMWWVYFDRPAGDLLTTLRRTFVWGYGHYLVFGAAAAVGAGLSVVVDQSTGHAAVGSTAAGAAVAIPVSVYLTCLWILHDRPGYGLARALGPLAAIVILFSAPTGHAVPLTAATLVGLVTAKVALTHPR